MHAHIFIISIRLTFNTISSAKFHYLTNFIVMFITLILLLILVKKSLIIFQIYVLIVAEY